MWNRLAQRRSGEGGGVGGRCWGSRLLPGLPLGPVSLEIVSAAGPRTGRAPGGAGPGPSEIWTLKRGASRPIYCYFFHSFIPTWSAAEIIASENGSLFFTFIYDVLYGKCKLSPPGFPKSADGRSLRAEPPPPSPASPPLHLEYSREKKRRPLNCRARKWHDKCGKEVSYFQPGRACPLAWLVEAGPAELWPEKRKTRNNSLPSIEAAHV